MRPAMKPPPLDEALADLLAQAQPLPGTDTVTTFDADGCVLAQSCVSAPASAPRRTTARWTAMPCVALMGVGRCGVARVAAHSCWQCGRPAAARHGGAHFHWRAGAGAGADAILMQEDR